MTIIEVKKSENGAHNENTLDFDFTEFLPPGWAILPESVGNPSTLKNYPFGEITVEDRDGVPTVTGWTPLPIPEPERPEEPEERYTAEDLLRALAGA